MSVARSSYALPAERALWPWLVASLAVLTLGFLSAFWWPQEPALPPMVEVELGLDLAEAPQSAPMVAVAEPVPAPESLPPPVEEMPVPEPPPPAPTPEPLPAKPAEFVVPEPAAPAPMATPSPTPAPRATPRPLAKPAVAERRAEPRPAEPTAVRATPGSARPPISGGGGSPTVGQRAGAGNRSDFIRTPQPEYDATARQRNYQGRGVFTIRYANGGITSVAVAQSTGIPYLDARTTAWIQSRWRVKGGSSGAVSLPVRWQLR